MAKYKRRGRYITFYHGTEKGRVKKILRDGLKLPKKGRTYQAPIYLTDRISTASKFSKNGKILKVKLSKSFFNRNCGYQESEQIFATYAVCSKSIKPEWIKPMTKKQSERKIRQEFRQRMRSL